MTPRDLAELYAIRDRREWWRVSQIGSMLIAALTGSRPPIPVAYSPFARAVREEMDPDELSRGLLDWATAHNARRAAAAAAPPKPKRTRTAR